MMKTKLAGLVAAIGLMLAAAMPMWAHHSFAAEFDGNKPMRLQGVLTKIEWTNPHSYFYIDVTDDKGNVVNWGCEGGGPGALSRRGFKTRRHQTRRQDCGRRLSARRTARIWWTRAA